MKVFLDSSALAKRYVAERGSEAVDGSLASASSLGLSIVCLPEIISALCRRRRERAISDAQYELAKRALLDDVADADVVNVTPDVLSRTVEILERYPIKALDAIHIACALEWAAETFVSSDARQLAAAAGLGLSVVQA